jgi:two-component system, sensor histidine kinase FlrB
MPSDTGAMVFGVAGITKRSGAAMPVSRETSCSHTSLEEAFGLFNQTSNTLTESYGALERGMSELTHELMRANDAREHEQGEVERVANRLARVLAALPAGVIVLNGDGVVVQTNACADEMLGVPLHGERWYDVIVRAFDLGRNTTHDVFLCDGRRVSVATCSLDTAPGQVLLLCDVTDTRRLQEQFARQQRLSAIGEMVAGLAHQIRTPLATAMLYAGQLQTGIHAPARVDTLGAKIQAALQHLDGLVNDMLVFARGEISEKAPISINGLVEALPDLVEAQLSATNCRMEVVTACPEVQIYGNRDALLGALQNIISNAIEACGPSGRIQMTVSNLDDNAVELRIDDNGSGIPEQIHERIFEPFFTTRSQGTGLGLAIVRSVVHAHGGDMRVSSQVGIGSTFTIRFPRYDHPCKLSGVDRGQSKPVRATQSEGVFDE